MSAIYGIYNIDKKGCDVCFKQLSRPFLNSDRADAWYIDNIALGQNTVYNTHDSLLDMYPLKDDQSSLVLIGDIRLDNKAQLIKKLQLSSSADKTDGQLILNAYRKWETNCVEHLLGDFAFVIWDANKQQLHCFADHFATVPLYYYYNGQKFIFASDIQQIVAVDGVPNQINDNKLSTLVIDAAKELFRTETWFKDIYPVPAATVITVSKDGIRNQRYWKPAVGNTLYFKNEMAFREAFQDIFFSSVKERLNSHYPVTALLSGGLDSSAVVAVAAKILEKENKTLDVFSSVLPEGDKSGIEDERYYIDLFKKFPNINIHYIDETNTGFLDNLDKLNTSHTAAPLTSRHYLYDAFAKRATTLGSRTILDGAYGELGPTFHGHGIYAEQLKKFNWLWLMDELITRKKITKETITHNLRYHTLKPFVPDEIIYKVRGESELLKPNKFNFINSNLATELVEQLKHRKEYLPRRFTTPSYDHKRNQIKVIKTIQHKGNPRESFDLGEYRYPFKDIRLIEFALNTPAEYKIKNGYKRYMIRSGLDGILPKEIQWRNDKKPFSPDYYRKYNKQIEIGKAFLNAISENDPIRNVVDVEKLKRWAEIPVSNTEKDRNTINIALHYLPQGIYLIHFLRRFREFQ